MGIFNNWKWRNRKTATDLMLLPPLALRPQNIDVDATGVVIDLALWFPTLYTVADMVFILQTDVTIRWKLGPAGMSALSNTEQAADGDTPAATPAGGGKLYAEQAFPFWLPTIGGVLYKELAIRTADDAATGEIRIWPAMLEEA